MVLVDTNVILDVVQDDPVWAEWSQGQLDAWAVRGELAINAVIYAELSIAYARIEELEDTVDTAELRLLEIPREALFLAGKAFLAYRRQRGERIGVLRFLCRCACASHGAAAADSRDRALPNLLSCRYIDHTRGLNAAGVPPMVLRGLVRGNGWLDLNQTSRSRRSVSSPLRDKADSA